MWICVVIETVYILEYTVKFTKHWLVHLRPLQYNLYLILNKLVTFFIRRVCFFKCIIFGSKLAILFLA